MNSSAIRSAPAALGLTGLLLLGGATVALAATEDDTATEAEESTTDGATTESEESTTDDSTDTDTERPRRGHRGGDCHEDGTDGTDDGDDGATGTESETDTSSL